MSDTPSDLSAMLEAVEKYMGEQFTEMLAWAIVRSNGAAYDKGRVVGDRLARDFR